MLFARDISEILEANGYMYAEESIFYSANHVPVTAYIYVSNDNKVEFYNRLEGVYIYVS